jgi:hypothetical protein
MNISTGNCITRSRASALPVCLVLCLLATTLAITGLSSAVAEFRMASAAHHRERAFQAAEYAIEQAIRTTTLHTTLTLGSPLLVPSSGPPVPVPGSGGDAYAYRLYHASPIGGLPVPGSGASATGVRAFHFVIEATGYSAQGAVSEQVQGFYAVGATGPGAVTLPPGCPLGAPRCGPPSDLGRIRTYWLQPAAE